MSIAATATPRSASVQFHRVARARAVLALAWAAVIVVAAGDTGPELSAGLALAVAAYPVIDLVASLVEASTPGPARTWLRASAVLSGAAVVGLAIASIGSDVGSVLAVFGAWAIASGLVQLAGALARRRSGTAETPALLSGAISAVAGVTFLNAAGQQDPALGVLAGYAAFGAVLFLVGARRRRA